MRIRARYLGTPLALAVLASATLGACQSWSRQDKGVAVGAAAGGAVGGVVGKQVGNTAAGIIIGAAVGGTVGGIIGRQMDRQADELEQNIPGATVARVGEGIVVNFESGLLFPFDSYQLKPAARDNLRNLAQSLENYPRTDVVIIGHTDSIGTEAYNQRLSERRAEAAKSFLAQLGVEPGRIKTLGMGESDPVAVNASEAGREQNRRVEVVIYASEEYRQALERQAGDH